MMDFSTAVINYPDRRGGRIKTRLRASRHCKQNTNVLLCRTKSGEQSVNVFFNVDQTLRMEVVQFLCCSSLSVFIENV